mgnify:CR=1 FL=1
MFLQAIIVSFVKNTLIKKVTYVYESGRESEPLPRFIHFGMFTYSVLFGEECQIRFFIHPFSLRLYDTDVDSLNRIQQRLMDLTDEAPDNLYFATLSKSLSDKQMEMDKYAGYLFCGE